MLSFFKRKNSKKNSSIDNVNKNSGPSAPERDEQKISMVQFYKEKSKSADHNIQQVPSNKCSQNIELSRTNDRERNTSPLDENIIEDKNKSLTIQRNERESRGLQREISIDVKSAVVSSESPHVNGSCTLNQNEDDIDQVIRRVNKNKHGDFLCEDASKKSSEQTLLHGDTVNLFRDNQYANKDVKTGKEVINLLMPERNIKKSDFISKSAVQNLFDIMGGGKKRKNKNNKAKTPELSNRKSWSFNNTKIKSDLSFDREKSILNSCKAQDKIELQRSASVPSANVVSEPVTDSISNKNSEKDSDKKNNDTQRQSLPIEHCANKSLKTIEKGVIESTSASNSTCQNNNKRQSLEKTPANQHNDKTYKEKRGVSFDDLQTNVTSDLIGNCAKTVGSRPEHCENVVYSNSTSSKCDTDETCNDYSADFVKSLVLDKYFNNTKINDKKLKTPDEFKPCLSQKEHTFEAFSEEKGYIHESIIESRNQVVNSDNHLDMGASDSRQRGGRESGNRVDKSSLKDENTTGNFDYVFTECGRSQGEAVYITQGENTVVLEPQLDVNVLSEINEFSSTDNSVYLSEISSKIAAGSCEMEEVSKECSEECGTNESNAKRLKNILKDNAELESKVGTKKHVTFHKIIHFDDGDNLEDDDSVSFASLDDEDDEVDEVVELDSNKADNCEVLFPDIEEASDDSVSSETNECLLNSRIREFKHKNDASVVIQEINDEPENNENLGCDVPEEKSPDCAEHTEKDPVNKAFNKIIEVKEVSESEEEEDEESDSEEVETCEESNSEDENESGDSSSVSENEKKKVIFDSDKVVEEVRKQESLWEVDQKEEDNDSAYAELLRVVERQLMRGIAGQEGRLADLQERAAALHRVQSEVCSARKEAELVRQKLKHVEGDLAATRTRNCQLVEQLEARAEDIRQAERKADELAEEVVRLQQKLDEIQPEYEELKGLKEKLKKNGELDKTGLEEALRKEQALREEREKAWKIEFEKLRSQSAENEELLLADCEWKLRDVQKSASERCAKAEGKLAELQKTADAKCALAEKQIDDLRIEISSLRSNSLEQQRALRQSAQQTGILEAAKNALEQESKRLKTLLHMEMDKAVLIKAQHAKELDEKDRRMMIRLAEEAKKAEIQGRLSRKAEECTQHDKALREANRKIQELKDTLAKKEAQFSESLEKAEARADWQILEIRRSLDKAEMKYSEALEKLQNQYTEDTERITAESEKRIKELENVLSAQTCSSRATLELVRERLQAEHTDAMLKLKEQHRIDMEKQWDTFTRDKEQCLERMKTECMMEGDEQREKRDKQLLKDIDELKQELETRERDVGSLRSENKKAIEARASAERKLSEAQAALVAREIAVRSEAARQVEVERKEAKDTIEHLTKKCACLTSLFEDMRSRWQQAPGEAAQLRKALQDEKARAQALRRQLDALSRDPGVIAEHLEIGDERDQLLKNNDDRARNSISMEKRVEKDVGIGTVDRENRCRKRRRECTNKHNVMNECDSVIFMKMCGVDNHVSNKGNLNICQNLGEIDNANGNSNELSNMWTLVQKGGLRKRGKRTKISPPRNVDLPAVTVPVRIRQFDPNRKKKT